MTTKNVELLRENGPMALSELPNKLSVNDRFHYDVRRYNPMGRFDPIAYIPDEHSMVSVARVAVETNPGLLEKSCAHLAADFGNHSGELRDGWREIREDYPETRAGGTGSVGQSMGATAD